MYPGPKSLCRCDHLGDGPGSDHEDGISEGHGACRAAGCDCQRFTWKKFTDVYEVTIKKVKPCRPM